MKLEIITFSEAMAAIVVGKCVQRLQWSRDYGNKIIGLSNGSVKQFRFDYWSEYSISREDLDAEDWIIIGEAPSLSEILDKCEELKSELSLSEEKDVNALELVTDLRQMIIKRVSENKRLSHL